MSASIHESAVAAPWRVDPFPAGPSVAGYVPRPATEQLLAYLEAKLLAGPCVLEIEGPHGVGKTLLLRLLARRCASRVRCVFVPYPALAPDELARWTLHALDADAGGAPLERFDAAVAQLRAARRPLALLVDEAKHLPDATLRWLLSRCEEPHGLRAVLAGAERGSGARAERLRVFAEPLSLAEVVPYVRAQLARAGAPPELRALFSGDGLQALALASEGLPRQIQRLADALILSRAALRSAFATPAPLAQPARPASAPSAPRSAPPARPDVRPGSDPGRTRARSSTHLAPAVAGALFLVPLLLALPGRLGELPAAEETSVPLVLERPFEVALVLDGRPLASTQDRVALSPGAHVVEVALPDGRRVVQRFVAEGVPLTLQVRGDAVHVVATREAPAGRR